ncbi:hypothetical protein F652_3904 [Enterobacteriaceae bacterium bta3-1]|nr:hypothetical protein F652_3904 [Enterobacteriaceae bacterium bta3-1]
MEFAFFTVEIEIEIEDIIMRNNEFLCNLSAKNIKSAIKK